MIRVNCETCKKEIKRFPSNMKSKSGFFFCDTKCRVIFQKERKDIFPKPPVRLKEKNNKWNGGKTVDRYGYEKVLFINHPMADSKGYVYTHRLLMSQNLGRLLKRTEWVHHIDGDRKNNSIENLEIMSQKEHKVLHGRLSPNLPKLKCKALSGK